MKISVLSFLYLIVCTYFFYQYCIKEPLPLLKVLYGTEDAKEKDLSITGSDETEEDDRMIVGVKDKEVRVVTPTKTAYCDDRTSYLKTYTSNIYEPYLADVISTFTTNTVEIIIILNLYHMDIVPREAEKHRMYLLEYNRKNYTNMFRSIPTFDKLLSFRYIIPLTDFEGIVQDKQSIYFTLYNLVQQRAYRNIHSCISVPPKEMNTLSICAYGSPFNPIDELYTWIAYYQLQKVEKFIIYLGRPYPKLQKSIRKYVKQGIVELVDWSWPIAGVVWQAVPQREHQASQAMSCYYRNRHLTKYLILCDMDEFIITNMTQNDLVTPIEAAFRHYPGKNALRLNSYYYFNKNRNSETREELWKKGTFFDHNNLNWNKVFPGKKKLILKNTFQGAIDIHSTLWDLDQLISDFEVLKIAHFKRNVFYQDYHVDTSLSRYSKDIYKQYLKIKADNA